MLTFSGYGKIEDVQMGDGIGLGIRTTGEYAKVLPLFFPERLSKPKNGDWVYIYQGEVILYKKDFTLLKVIAWQTMDGKTRGKYAPKADAEYGTAAAAAAGKEGQGY
jgi:hypothetical protein